MAHQEMQEIYDDVEDSNEEIYDDVEYPQEQPNAKENIEEYLAPIRHPQSNNRGYETAYPHEQPNAKENFEEYLAPIRHPQSNNRRDETAHDFQQKMRENGEKHRKKKNITIVLLFHSVLSLGAIAGAIFAIYDGKIANVKYNVIQKCLLI